MSGGGTLSPLRLGNRSGWTSTLAAGKTPDRANWLASAAVQSRRSGLSNRSADSLLYCCVVSDRAHPIALGSDAEYGHVMVGRGLSRKHC